MRHEGAPTQADNWNAHWEHFAQSASENPAQTYRHRTLLWLFERTLSAVPTRFLDLGSGQGDFLARAAKRWPEAELVGLELSEVGVLTTRRKVSRARVFAADLLFPKAEIAVFQDWANAAVCCEVLEHLDDPVAFLRAASRYLASGATLIVTVPGGPMSAFDRLIGHRQHFTRGSITCVLEQAGFAVDRVALAGFPFFNIYRALVIARGNRLAEDVTRGSHGLSSSLARGVMAMFRILFRANLFNSPFGWQVIAVAHKVST
jgi:SAM-dependent methyltransferase